MTSAGLVLQLNGANNLPVSASGNFSFAATLSSGASYTVAVLTQPANPAQLCTVSAGSGAVAANVTNVAVACADAAPVTTPVLTLTGTLYKWLHFEWTTVTGATFYRLYRDPTGSVGFTQFSPDNPGTFFNLLSNLHRDDWSQPTFTVRACNLSGCGPQSNIVNGQSAVVTAIDYRKNAADADDFFGNAVAISADGNTMAIGARYDDSNAVGIDGDSFNNSAHDAGSVTILTRSALNGSWNLQAYIKASNPNADDTFGYSVALSADGNTLAVGAIGEDSNATGVGGNQLDNSTSRAGAVYVFVRNGTDWVQQAYVKASNPEANDVFGSLIALSGDGNTLAVSAISEDSAATGINGSQASNTATSAGAVYVFTRTATVWSQQAYVKASNTGAQDFFGYSIALSNDGNTLAIGAVAEQSDATGIDGDQTSNTASNAGAVYVFTRAATVWSQEAYVKASNTEAGDEFGDAVSLPADGNVLIVGAPGEDSGATGVNGNQADNSASLAGAAYVFVRTGSTWSQESYLKASNTDAGDQFGVPVVIAADGNTLAIAARAEDSNAVGVNGNQSDNSAGSAGAVYVYARSGSSWNQLTYVKASNTEADDHFGESLALTGNGTTLAIGAPFEDGDGSGFPDDQTNNAASSSGAVYLY